MKKIGIVTWHYNPNYGGLLQAYALQEIIKKMGYKPEFINYRQDVNSINKWIKRKIKNAYIMIFRTDIYLGRIKKKKFIKNYLNTSKTYYSYSELKKEANEIYDVGICGSDQIWSNNNGVNQFFYLDFLESKKRISYAPSIGYNFILESMHEKFRDLVLKINYLSVREDKGAEIIESVTGVKSEVVLDPTLLISKNEWLKKINNKRRIYHKFDYVLLYILGESKEQVNYAKEFSKRVGCKLIALETKYGKIKSLEIINGDPLDFVELVSNASYVLTDSFHGVAFSINFEKQFVAFKRFKDNDSKSQNSRIYNILDKTKLMSRFTNTNIPISFLQDNLIDYSKVNYFIEREREYSLKFLENSIKDVLK